MLTPLYCTLRLVIQMLNYTDFIMLSSHQRRSRVANCPVLLAWLHCLLHAVRCALL